MLNQKEMQKMALNTLITFEKKMCNIQIYVLWACIYGVWWAISHASGWWDGAFCRAPYQISVQFVEKHYGGMWRGGEGRRGYFALGICGFKLWPRHWSANCLFALANYISLAAHTCWAWPPLVKRGKDIRQATEKQVIN